MKSLKYIFKLLIVIGISSLFACSTPDSEPIVYRGSDPLPPEGTDSPENSSNAVQRARIIADILYEAKYALDDNKLQRPAGDNAYDRYLEVLSVEPKNEVAIQGIKDIVLRYVELADAEMKLGQYDNAETMLNRGASINPGSDDILAALFRLEEAKKVKVDFIALDTETLSQQSTEMLVKLSDIADQIRMNESTFLITARSDEEGRWIYKIMRESVGGYRLRGNIILGNEPGIQINSIN